ncbi:MAG: isocitrate lyase, partial [Acetobacteraceae bacterium]|nr:isocitrate lyase [Acetobacteraceae bacterium]
GIKRGYSAADVVKLRGSVHVEHTLAKRGAEKLWSLINSEPFVNTLGALIVLDQVQIAGRYPQPRCQRLL